MKEGSRLRKEGLRRWEKARAGPRTAGRQDGQGALEIRLMVVPGDQGALAEPRAFPGLGQPLRLEAET